MELFQKLGRHSHRLLSALMLGFLVNSSSAAVAVSNAERLAPDFVKVSLLWIGPGSEFFACAGHASLRLECPTFKKDYCFSCESESIREHPVRFVMGELKTGLFAIPTSEFLKIYAEAGRGCRQYPLELPPDVKLRLWEILDKQVAQGRCLPYDYIKYCCVQTMLQPLLQAIPPRKLEVAPWPEIYRLTRREMLANEFDWCPWTRFVLHTIAGTEVDADVDNFKRVILSREFVELLRGAKIDGRPILSGEGDELLSARAELSAPLITPMVIGVILLLVAIFNWLRPIKPVSMMFLGLQTAIGVLIMHLVLVSSLPATDWNWLIIPFNVLPLCFWKWRRQWALPYCIVLAAWLVFVIAHPHQLTDPAYYFIVAAYCVFYRTKLS